MIRILDVRPKYPVAIGYEQFLGIPGGSVLSFDGSTSSTGIGLLSITGVPLASIRMTADVEADPILYKVQFKRLVEWLLLSYPTLIEVCYEEPGLENANSIKALFGLRTTIPEVLIEQKEAMDHRVKFIEIPNGKWKKLFLAPDKIPPGTDLQKIAVRNKLARMYPWASDPLISEDECDAFGQGIAFCSKSIVGEEDDMQSKKAVKPFQFVARIIGADTDDEFIGEYTDRFKKLRIPKRFDGNIELTPIELPGTGRFDKHVFNNMRGDDKVLVLKFKSTSYAPTLLEYDLDNEAVDYNYAYALVWRKTKKG